MPSPQAESLGKELKSLRDLASKNKEDREKKEQSLTDERIAFAESILRLGIKKMDDGGKMDASQDL